MYARGPFHPGVHKLHFDNNAELTLSLVSAFIVALPLIEARDRSAPRSRITNAVIIAVISVIVASFAYSDS